MNTLDQIPVYHHLTNNCEGTFDRSKAVELAYRVSDQYGEVYDVFKTSKGGFVGRYHSIKSDFDGQWVKLKPEVAVALLLDNSNRLNTAGRRFLKTKAAQKIVSEMEI